MAGVLAELADEGTTAPRVLLFDGPDGAWASSSFGDGLHRLEGILTRLPRVLVGVVRGRCVGAAASLLASRLDILIGVSPRPATESEVRFTMVADEETVGAIVERISEAVAARPEASCVAAGVLRQAGLGSTAAGQVREAMAYSLLQMGMEHQTWLAEARG
jgi:hypothetical protein